MRKIVFILSLAALIYAPSVQAKKRNAVLIAAMTHLLYSIYFAKMRDEYHRRNRFLKIVKKSDSVFPYL